MNEHSISYMQKCMAHDFNDYENLVICRDLLAQISKRPMPQGMDYDPKSDSFPMLAIIFVVRPAASLKSSFLMLRSINVCQSGL